MTRAASSNYRVDFIAVHYYQKSTPANFYARLRGLWTKYGRPIWVTEFNYGATWNPLPADSMAYFNGLKAYIDMLDTCAFIEHYFVYPWWGTADSVLSIFKTETPPTHTYAGRWFTSKPDYYGYRSAVINKGDPIEISSVACPPAAQIQDRPGIVLRGHRIQCEIDLAVSAEVSFELFTLGGKRILQPGRKKIASGKILLSFLVPQIAHGALFYRMKIGPRVMTGFLTLQ
jgi:hypothetical protein